MIKNDSGMQTFSMRPKELWVHDFDDQDVMEFSEKVSELFEENPHRPIIINIKSYGGSVHGLFAMMDIMDSVSAVAPEDFCFITYGIGVAMSAGAMLLSYGDYRFASPKCTIMLHHIVAGTGWGMPHPDNKVEFFQQDKLNEQVIELLAASCMVSDKKQLAELIDRNLYMTPQEALDFGLIDGVGSPRIVERTAYELQVLNSKPPKEPAEKPKKKTTKKKVSK